MTTTWRHKMVCECGHIGYLKHRENDQPFSSSWEEWSMEGFGGQEPDYYTLTIGEPLPGVICPACGQTGKVVMPTKEHVRKPA